ncbi:MAG TPA: hypothetical protein VLI54_00760 [Bacillota bacterium]|nr:hypothetical protein [Bacillota bacterium]
MIGGEAAGNGELIANIQLAQEVSDRLIAADIDFCVFSGFHAALLAAHRQTPDIDFWADHTKWDQLVETFPDASILDRRITKRPGDPYDGVLITLGGGDVSVMSGTIIFSDNVSYPSPFTDLVRENRVHTTMHGLKTWYANPADTLLFKAISQRGRAQGKHDLDDIAAINNAVSIDRQYLLQRIHECHAAARTIPLLLQMGVLSEADLLQYVA